MAQSTAQVGNLNITTQVFPAANASNGTVPDSVKNAVPMVSKRFKKTPIKALSSILMLTGILQLSIGVVMFSSENNCSLTVRSGVSIWAGLVIFIAGGTSLISLFKDTIDLIKLCMVSNIANITVAAIGLILYSIQIYYESQTCWLTETETDGNKCHSQNDDDEGYYGYYYNYRPKLSRIRISVNALIMVFSLLGMAVSGYMVKASDKALKDSGYSLLR